MDCELWRNGEGGYHKWLLDSQANSEERGERRGKGKEGLSGWSYKSEMRNTNAKNDTQENQPWEMKWPQMK